MALSKLEKLGFKVKANGRIDFDNPPVRFVRCRPIRLVVVHLGNWATPIDDEVTAHLVGHAGSADVNVLRCIALRELQAHFRKIRFLEQKLCAAELFGIDVS